MSSGGLHDDRSNGNGHHRVSVMLVDDDPTFLRVAVTQLRRTCQKEIDVVGTASSGEECLIEAQLLAPEVVLIDLNMPGRGGLGTIPLLHILFPETRVIALTLDDRETSRKAVLAAGGSDLVSKAAWKTDLIPAIERALGRDVFELGSVSD